MPSKATTTTTKRKPLRRAIVVGTAAAAATNSNNNGGCCHAAAFVPPRHHLLHQGADAEPLTVRTKLKDDFSTVVASSEQQRGAAAAGGGPLDDLFAKVSGSTSPGGAEEEDEPLEYGRHLHVDDSDAHYPHPPLALPTEHEVRQQGLQDVLLEGTDGSLTYFTNLDDTDDAAALHDQYSTTRYEYGGSLLDDGEGLGDVYDDVDDLGVATSADYDFSFPSQASSSWPAAAEDDHAVAIAEPLAKKKKNKWASATKTLLSIAASIVAGGCSVAQLAARSGSGAGAAAAATAVDGFAGLTAAAAPGVLLRAKHLGYAHALIVLSAMRFFDSVLDLLPSEHAANQGDAAAKEGRKGLRGLLRSIRKSILSPVAAVYAALFAVTSTSIELAATPYVASATACGAALLAVSEFHRRLNVCRVTTTTATATSKDATKKKGAWKPLRRGIVPLAVVALAAGQWVPGGDRNVFFASGGGVGEVWKHWSWSGVVESIRGFLTLDLWRNVVRGGGGWWKDAAAGKGGPTALILLGLLDLMRNNNDKKKEE